MCQVNIHSPCSLDQSFQLQPHGTALLQEKQLGSSRRSPSPPPFQTPTHLCLKVKPIEHDTGLVHHTEDGIGEPTGSAVLLNADIVACTSHLFAGVPAQSTFLTCKMQTIGSQPMLLLGNSNTVITSPSTLSMLPAEVSGPPPITYDPVTDHGMHPLLEREVSFFSVPDFAHPPASTMITPPEVPPPSTAQTCLASTQPEGSPVPRVPNPPTLLDLLDMLVDVNVQKAAVVPSNPLTISPIFDNTDEASFDFRFTELNHPKMLTPPSCLCGESASWLNPDLDRLVDDCDLSNVPG
ncbi:hypothetical protein J3R82DRAFT_11152 [Butyriboletus roseoflavus]|nr:hypothetical protein J3R82DRAFT_11152 [Butyriboletus roseoflavus]